MNNVSVKESHLVFLTLFLCIFFFHFQHPALLCGIFCIVQLWAPTCTHKLEGHTLILTFSKKRKSQTTISSPPFPCAPFPWHHIWGRWAQGQFVLWCWGERQREMGQRLDFCSDTRENSGRGSLLRAQSAGLERLPSSARDQKATVNQTLAILTASCAALL